VDALNSPEDGARELADDEPGDARRLREANEELWAANAALGSELQAIRAALDDRARPIAALRAGTAPAGSMLAQLARAHDEERARHGEAERSLRVRVEQLEWELGQLRERERELEAGLQRTIALRDQAGHERDEARRALEELRGRAVFRAAARLSSRRANR